MKRIWPWIWRVAVVGVLVSIAFVGWQTWRKSEAKPLDQRFQLQEIALGDVTQTVTANGTLNPVVLVNVGTQANTALSSASHVAPTFARILSRTRSH